ncbi:VC0807 family protein [Spongiibacter tropicus]|uniref:VC0807 family protein n=1 Tax=Spongiibacter tropicus TaxID=454602 RepID=UPI003A9A1783
MPQPAKGKPRHSAFTNLIFNILVPTLILTKFSDEGSLGPQLSIVIALAFPLSFGTWDFIQTRRANVFSILGFVSTLLTGGISLLELDPQYIAIKEASIPGLIGLATLISLYTPYPLIKTLLFNDEIVDTERVNQALDEHDAHANFEVALRRATYLLAFSFFLSATLNYILAKVLLVSPPGTPEYSAELGKMTGLSFPVIALPCTVVMMAALFYLMRRVRQLTALELEQIFRLHQE